MPTITPYIPTPEELAESARSPVPTGGSAAHPNTAAAQSPGFPAPAPAAQAYPGSALAAYAPVQAVPGQPPPPRPPLAPFVLTAEQLAALDIPPRPALLDGWLCQGDLGYIFAPRGVGKTWMAMALPGAISCRRPLGLWQAGDSAPGAKEADPDAPPAPAPIPVLYIDGEMALKHTQYRARGLDLSQVHHLHHEHLFEQNGTSLNIGEAEDRQRITDLVIQQGYQVLILDNLSSLAAGIDENKGMDYEPLSHWLLDLRRRKITVIVIHHAGRNGLMRGHSKREDACSWILELRDARQENDPGAKFVSHFAKPSRNSGEPLPDLLWHFTTRDDGVTEIKCELAVTNDYETFILHVLEGVTSQKDIAEMMNKNKGTVSKWARKALEEKRLSGNAHKLLPPKQATSMRVKSHYHPDEDEGDEDEDHDP